MKTLQYVWQQPHWPQLTWDAGQLITPLAACRLAQGRLLARMQSFGVNLETLAWAEVLTAETVTTSAIEGEHFAPQSVRSSVQRRLGLETGGVPPAQKAEGLIGILIDASQRHEVPLTQQRLMAWHRALFPAGMSGFHEITTGAWRTGPMAVVSGRAGSEHIHFEAVPADRVSREMERFLEWFNAPPGDMDGIIRAGCAHFWFVTIHPFEDGNGRIARAITDLAVAQDDQLRIRCYSMSQQILARRKEYYAVLERTQKGSGDITEWIHWFLGCFLNAIEYSDVLLQGVMERAEFWKRHAGASINERQRKVINRLLESSPDAFEGGMNTRKYCSLTGASRATAFRELDALVELGMLRREGQGRSTRYTLG